MNARTIRMATIVPLMGLASACAAQVSDAGDDDPLSGTFELILHNGTPLPADLGRLGPRTGNEVRICHVLVTAGTLTLQASPSAFEYRYEVRDSCDQRLLGMPQSSGSYSRQGASLHFTVQAQDTVITFSGQLQADRIVLERADLRLEFRR